MTVQDKARSFLRVEAAWIVELGADGEGDPWTSEDDIPDLGGPWEWDEDGHQLWPGIWVDDEGATLMVRWYDGNNKSGIYQSDADVDLPNAGYGDVSARYVALDLDATARRQLRDAIRDHLRKRIHDPIGRASIDTLPIAGTPQPPHPYIQAKARAWMLRAGGRPQDADQLAQWAQIAWYADRMGMPRVRNRGVLVAADGTLMAETRRHGRKRGIKAQHVNLDDMERLTGSAYPSVVDMAMGRIRHEIGQPVAHARFSELCEGPSEAEVDDK